MRLIMVCVATSIDAFAAGLSLGLLNFNPYLSVITIALITLILTLIGVYLGKIFGRILGKWAEFAGSVILFIIGIKILVSSII